jgi:nucleoside-diphosphate-sugar epimerase
MAERDAPAGGATMNVFVAGASGTIGVPLVRALVTAGHHVTAMTRSPEKQAMLKDFGAVPVVADALDADAVMRVVVASKPDVVIHQLTALPKAGVKKASDLDATNRLRSEGTRYLLAAAIAAHARRIIAGSFALFRDGASTGDAGTDQAAAAVASMEGQILDASRRGAIEGVVLRYGLFYGPHNPATDQMITLVRRRMLPVVRGDKSLLPVIHIDDAVSATVAALDRGPAGQVYDIVDDRPVSMTDIVVNLAERAGAPKPFAVPAWIPRLLAPYLAQVTSLHLNLTNSAARAGLGWHPAFPTFREGVAQTLSNAA